MVRTYKKKTDREHVSTKPKTVPAKFKSGFLAEMDGRTELTKALKANYQTIIDDLGGDEEISHIKNALIERFVWLEAFLHTLEQRMAAGELSTDEALGKWTQSVNALASLASKLGMNKAKSGRWVETLMVAGAPQANGHSNER